MTHAERRYGDWFKVGGAVVLVALALPLVALLAFIGRGVLLGAAVLIMAGALVAYAVSPGFRAWVEGEAEREITFSGLRLATDRCFHPAHGWARIEGNEATVGADDLLQTALGPVERVTLPRVGDTIRRGDPMLRLERGERSVELVAPVSGTVTNVNRAIEDDPGLVNRAPFGDGWLARIHDPGMRTERAELLRGSAARSWFRNEVDRLVARLSPGQVVPALADGGALVEGLHLHIDDVHWDRLKEEFFAAGRL